MNDVRQPVAVVWKEMLSGIFSTLGRLALLASCRHPVTGRYYHPRLTNCFESDDLDEALRSSHKLAWRDWMLGSLEQQHADVYLYLRDLSTDFERLVSLWLECVPFTEFAPECATEAERSLFLSNLKIALQLLHNQLEKPFHVWACDPDPLWGRLAAFIAKNYSQPGLSLDTVSAALNMPKRKLAAMFQSQTGHKFRTYLRDIRIEEAAKLLATSNEEIKAISILVGYTDQSHFARYFHQITGRTPVEYRRQKRKLAFPAANLANK